MQLIITNKLQTKYFNYYKVSVAKKYYLLRIKINITNKLLTFKKIEQSFLIKTNYYNLVYLKNFL